LKVETVIEQRQRVAINLNGSIVIKLSKNK
jgi:hypothetical protein